MVYVDFSAVAASHFPPPSLFLDPQLFSFFFHSFHFSVSSSEREDAVMFQIVLGWSHEGKKKKRNVIVALLQQIL